VAACGAPVAKMSGRALGHTGGTLDKLESIPGFSVYMTPEQFVDSVNRLKVAVIGQTAAIAPADGKWYKLRDVTATVESVPLIAASIMSKKLAAGADALVLDVKAGRGAFLKKFEDTLKLAETMVSIGTRAGRRTVALITDMNQPLGRAVGNALEVKEAVETVQGRGPDDLTELTLALGTEMLVLAQVAEDATDARRRLGEAIRSGRALEKFREMVVNQGGDPAFIDDPSRLPTAPVRVVVEARASGWVDAIDGHELGDVTMLLGAGRRKQDDEIDHAVGLVLRAKVGSRVEAGDVLCEVHAARPEDAAALTERIRAAFSIGPPPPEPRPLVLRRVSADWARPRTGYARSASHRSLPEGRLCDALRRAAPWGRAGRRPSRAHGLFPPVFRFPGPFAGGGLVAPGPRAGRAAHPVARRGPHGRPQRPRAVREKRPRAAAAGQRHQSVHLGGGPGSAAGRPRRPGRSGGHQRPGGRHGRHAGVSGSRRADDAGGLALRHR